MCNAPRTRVGPRFRNPSSSEADDINLAVRRRVFRVSANAQRAQIGTGIIERNRVVLSRALMLCEIEHGVVVARFCVLVINSDDASTIERQDDGIRGCAAESSVSPRLDTIATMQSTATSPPPKIQVDHPSCVLKAVSPHLGSDQQDSELDRKSSVSSQACVPIAWNVNVYRWASHFWRE